jgi:uncharacterized protein
MSDASTPTPRTRLVREPQRAVYDRAAVYKILDEGLICHVGFVLDDQPFVIPTSYGRRGDNLYIHGSSASRMLRHLDKEIPVCVTVTLLDGLVLARSIFNHSMNYRSVVVLGTAVAVTDPAEKLKATTALRLPITEFSAKVRQGGVIDDEDDYAFPTWAGVIPLTMVPGAPLDDHRLLRGQQVPEYAKHYKR